MLRPYASGARAPLLVPATLALTLALTLSVPALALVALRRIDPQDGVARRVALLAFASPALYTLLYVATAAAGASADDRLGWCAAWAGFALAAAVWPPSAPRDVPAPRAARGALLARAHGIAAALVVGLFLAAHLGNQLVALRGIAAHTAVLHVLRSFYRAAWVEPVLLAVFAFLAASGAAHVRARRPRFAPDRQAHERVLHAFLSAVASGDIRAMEELLVTDAVAVSDGGGRVRGTARRPVRGASAVARLLVGVTRRWPPQTVGFADVNGEPGLVVRGVGGAVTVVSLETDGNLVFAVRLVRNPDKLRAYA